MRWTSVAGLILEDGASTLVFDPSFTRPGFLHWLGLKRLFPDTELVHENLQALQLKKADAVFVSHTHFDHALDAPLVSQVLGAPLLGGGALERLEKGNRDRFGWQRSLFRKTVPGESINVGEFKVTPLLRSHAAIFPRINFHFLPGEVPLGFDFKFDHYREGENWAYVIEHPKGKIYVDQGSHFHEPAAPLLQGVDYMFIGLANKKSEADWIANHVERFHPKVLIPLHFDLFFLPLDRKKIRKMPGTGMDGIRKKIESEHALTRFIEPKWGEPIVLGPLNHTPATQAVAPEPVTTGIIAPMPSEVVSPSPGVTSSVPANHD